MRVKDLSGIYLENRHGSFLAARSHDRGKETEGAAVTKGDY